MKPSEFITDAVGILTIIALVFGGARWLSNKLKKTRNKDIDERLKAILTQRQKDQEEGTPIERELRGQIDELKAELKEAREQHRKEVADMRIEHSEEVRKMREEHNREIEDLRRHFNSQLDTLRERMNRGL